MITKKGSIRFKVINRKKFLCCDYHGTCKNKAYAEVYPMLIKGKDKKGWSYLCKALLSRTKEI